MKYILSNDSVNSYGFWVLTAGIDLSRFVKNPIILVQHNDNQLSVGLMRLSLENGQLMGEPEFDAEDPIGKELKRKYEKGYMSGFSIGIEPIELSDSKEYRKTGQSRKTVTKCVLYEVSVANVPSNPDSVRLMNNRNTDNCTHGMKQGLTLSADGKTLLPDELNINETSIKLNLNMKLIALKLGLAEGASEPDILNRIEYLKVARIKAENATNELRTELKTLKDAEQKKRKETFETILTAKKDLSEEQRTTLRKLSEQDYDLAVKTVELMSKREKLSDVIDEHQRNGGNQSQGKQADVPEFERLQKKDPAKLAQLRTSNPVEFERLVKEYTEWKKS
jgi:HK97 family phage prohead protease